jgi:hypothetical protein
MSYRLLRALHGYTALALAALLLLYAASGWLIIHRIDWGRATETKREVPLGELAGAGPLDAARARSLALVAAERAGLSSAAVAGEAKPAEDGAWKVSLARVARSAVVTLRPATGVAELALRDAAFAEGVKRLHRVHAAGASGAKRAWVLAIDVLSLALIGFALTGLLMFFALKRDLRLGLAVLGASTLYTLGSLALLVSAR